MGTKNTIGFTNMEVIVTLVSCFSGMFEVAARLELTEE